MRGAGYGSSLTYRSAWLVFKGPSNKKDQTTTKKKHVFPEVRVLLLLKLLRLSVTGAPFEEVSLGTSFEIFDDRTISKEC